MNFIDKILKESEHNIFQPRRIEKREIEKQEKYKESEKLFLEITKGIYELPENNYRAFFNYNNMFIFYIQERFDEATAWVSINFWALLNKFFGENFEEKTDFLKDMFEKHLKLKIKHIGRISK